MNQQQSSENEKSAVQVFGFEKGEKSKTLPIKLLSESIRVEDNLGRAYRTRPVQAWNLLAMIVGLLKEHEINYRTTPIFVRSDSSGVALSDLDRAEKKYDKSWAPINKWIFDQLITKIEIPNIGNDLVNGAIAVSYTQKGINVAFGLNVAVCDNMSILGGQQLRTYKYGSSDGLNWDTMKIQLRHWIENIEQRMSIEIHIMNRMIEREINNEIVVDQVIGKLYQKAIEWRYFSGDQAPFDISGMSTFVQGVYNNRKKESLDNVWDLYNWGTNIMKPEFERLEHLTEASRLYADFLCQEFAIEREDLLQEIQIVKD